MRFSNARIDAFIEEDVPYIDLTCEVLGVHNQPAKWNILRERAVCLPAPKSLDALCEISVVRF